MKIQAESFKAALGIAFGPVSRRPIIPALGGVAISISDGHATITGCSGEMYLSVSVPIDSPTQAECILEREVLDYVSMLSGEMDISFKNGEMTIACSESTASFETMDYKEFNNIPRPSEESMRFSSNELIDGIYIVGRFRTSRESQIGEDVANCIYVGPLGDNTYMMGFNMQVSAGGAVRIEGKTDGFLLTPGLATSIGNLPQHSEVVISEDDRFLHLVCGNIIMSEIKYASKWRTPLLMEETSTETSVDGIALGKAVKRLLAAVPAHLQNDANSRVAEITASDGKFTIKLLNATEVLECTGDNIDPVLMNTDALLRFCQFSPLLFRQKEGNKAMWFTGDGFLGISTTMSKI